MLDDENNDILDDLKQTDNKRNLIDDIQTFSLMGSQWGLFIGLSWFQDKGSQMQGLATFMISIILMALVWMYPGYKAAIIAGSRIYLKATVYHGSFFTDRQFEVIDAPKVVACMDENDITVYEDELEYNELFNTLGITYLTDADIDSKIKTAVDVKYRKEFAEKIRLAESTSKIEQIKRFGGKLKWWKK